MNRTLPNNLITMTKEEHEQLQWQKQVIREEFLEEQREKRKQELKRT